MAMSRIMYERRESKLEDAHNTTHAIALNATTWDEADGTLDVYEPGEAVVPPPFTTSALMTVTKSKEYLPVVFAYFVYNQEGRSQLMNG